VLVVEKPTFERIVQDHGSFVRRTLAHLGVAARHVADVEQEVFRGVHRGLSAFDPSLAANPETAVRAWLFGICERQAASHRRAEMRRAEVLLATEDLDFEHDERPDSEESFVAAERKALLFQLLATLEPRRRAVIIAYELEGMDMVEVASAIGIPVNTCWNRLRLARADLRAAWTRLCAQQSPKSGPRGPSRGGAAAMVPFAFLSPSFAGDAAAPLGALGRLVLSVREWLFHSVREWLSGGVGERALGGLRRWLSGAPAKAVAAAKIAAVAASAAGLVAAIVTLRPHDSPARHALNTDARAADLAGSGAEIVPERQVPPAAPATSPGARTGGVPAETQAPSGSLSAVATPSEGGSEKPGDRRGSRVFTALASGSSRAGAPGPAGGGKAAVRSSGMSADVGLREETASLSSAETAYQSGDNALAARLLDSYDRNFPQGRMKGSSLLLRLRNLMATGCRNEARERARAYLAAHPDSQDRALILNIVGPL